MDTYYRMMSQDVAVLDNAPASRFELTLDGSQAGFLTYQLRPGAIALLHTEVDPAFEGRGLGTALIRGALDSARQRGLTVVPVCPFVKAHLTKHPDESG
jgi:predicted GNAT family acetyltransferase